MRIISVRDDFEQVVLQLVKAIPEVYLDYDLDFVQLVEYDNDRGLVAEYDIVVVESDEYEIVIGDVTVGTDLIVEIDIYPNEKELELTLDQVI